MAAHADERALAIRMFMQLLAYSFVIQFAWMRLGALRHIVVAHAQKRPSLPNICRS
jgi:hypothetical protein